MLLRVRLREEPDAEAHAHREQLQKRMRLDAEELLRGLREDTGAAAGSRAPATAADSFLGRLGAALLDNLRVHLARLHVRCEHHGPDGFAFGATLQRFEMCSTDVDWQPQYQRAPSRQLWLHKVLSLEGASVYWDASAAAGTEATREAVLPPTDASLRLRVSRARSTEGLQEAQTSWSCSLEPIHVRLTDVQYQGMMQLSADWTRRTLRERYIRHQPRAVGQAGPTPASRWRFARDCVLADLSEQRRWQRWAVVRPFLEQRREYVSLWRACLQGKPPTASPRLLELEQQLRLQDILLFRRLAARGIQALPHAASAGVQRPASTRRTFPRSASTGQLLDQRGSRPLADTPSATSESRLEHHAQSNHGAIDARAPEHFQSAESERGGSWLAWFWRSPDQSAASSVAGATDLDATTPVDDAGEYTPVRFTRAQLQSLQGWIHPAVEDDDGVGVTSAPSSSHGAASTPIGTQGQLRIRSLRLSLCCMARAGESTTAALFIVRLVAISLRSLQEVTERARTEFTVQTITLTEGQAPEGGSLVELLAPAAAAQDAPARAVLHVLQESWPASGCTWPEGGSWNPECEAGERISISVAPCRLLLAPSCAQLVRFFSNPGAPSAHPEPIVSAPSNVAVGLVFDGPKVALPFAGSDGAEHSLELRCGSLEIEEDPAGQPQREAVARLSGPPLAPMVVQRRLAARDVCLQFVDSSSAVTDLTQPTSFEVRLSEWTADGVSHTTIQGRVPEISMHIGQAQLHRLACLSKDLARPQTSAETSTQTPPVASGTGPVVKLDAALSVERLRVQLTNEHNTLVLEVRELRGTLSSLEDCRQLRLNVEDLRAALRHLHRSGVEVGELGHLRIRQLSAEHDSESRSSTELTRAQLGYAELCIAPRSVAGPRPAPSTTARAPALQSAAALMFYATDATSGAASVWFKREPSLDDAAVSFEICKVQLRETGPVAPAASALSALMSDASQWWQSAYGDAPPASLPVVQQPTPLAIRGDARSLVIDLPLLATSALMQCDGLALSVLSDGAGCVDGEMDLETLSMLGTADSLPPILSPLGLNATWAHRGGTEGWAVKVNSGAIQAMLLPAHLTILSAVQQHVAMLTTSPAADMEAPTQSSSRVDLVEVELPRASVTFKADHQPDDILDGDDSERRITVSVADLRVSMKSREGVGQSMTIQMQVLALSQGELARQPEQDAADDKLLQFCAPEDDVSPAVCFGVELLPGSMFAQATVPCAHICIIPSAATKATLATLQRLADESPRPEPSDEPFAMDLQISEIDVLVKDEAAAAAQSARLRSAVEFRIAASGGFAEPLRQQIWLHVPMLAVEHQRGQQLAPAVLLAPCSGYLRLRLGAQGRAALQCSDMQLRASYTQLRAVSALMDSLVSLAAPPAAPKLGTPSLLARQTASPALSYIASAQRTISSASSEISDASEYFDAPEHLEGEGRGLATPDIPGTGGSGMPAETRLEIYQGMCTATFIDDCGRPGAPLFQLVLAPSGGCAVFSSERARLSGTLGLSLYHYTRRANPAAPQGWEPVLEPFTCTVELALSDTDRTVSVASQGEVELNLLPGVVGSLNSLNRRLAASDGVGAVAIRSGATDSFAAGVLLRNDAGVPLYYRMQSGQSPSELAPNAEALLPDKPSVAAQTCLHVLFEGFQQLDLQAPYRDRYRLWPAARAPGRSPSIVYVIVHSRMVDGVEHLTLQSPFALLNATAAKLGVRLSKRDGAVATSILLQPGVREPVPLGFQCGLLEADFSAGGGVWPSQDDAAAGTQLELTVPSLQALRGRGGVMHLRSSHDPCCCYRLLSELPQQAPQCWLLSLHAPLVLHNSLLCGMEYELSDCTPSKSPATSSPVQHGRLERSSSVPIFCSGAWGSRASSECRYECYLRLRCDGLVWSQPVVVDLAQQLDDSGAAELPRREVEIRCPVSHARGPGPSVAGSDRDAAVVLRLHLARRPTGILAEVCGGVWAMNECHVPLHYQLGSDAASTAVLPACAPTLRTGGAESTPAAIPTMTPLRGVLEGELPDMVLSVAAGVSAHGGGGGGGGDGAFLSLSGLLRLCSSGGDQSEELHVAVPSMAQQGSTTGAGRSGGPFAAAGPVACLDLYARLVPLEHRLGRSLLLTVAPRFVLLNRTARPLQLRQRGCTAYVELPPFASERRLEPLHWHDARHPRQLRFRRPERGEEWSGAVPVERYGADPLVGGAEVTLRLRNLETGTSEFPRVSLHRLPGRPTVVLQVLDELPGSAPILVQNETSTELTFQQVGVPVFCSVAPGAALPYAWDEPVGRQQMQLHVPAAGVRFSCSTAPSRSRRPLLGGLLGRRSFELCVTSEGAVTRFLVREVAGTSTAPAPPPPPAQPRLGAIAGPPEPINAAAGGGGGGGGSGGGGGGGAPLLHVQLQLPTVGLTFFDERPRELLYLSLRGLRLALNEQRPGGASTQQRSLALAVASAQLDCQLPRRARHEEVLLRSGASVRRDAVSVELTLSDGGEALTLLHHANAALQEITLRVDEEALTAVVAALQLATAADAGATAAAADEAKPSSFSSSSRTKVGVPAELRTVHEAVHEALLREGAAGAAASSRLFVRHFKLQAVKLKLSLQRATSMNDDEGGGQDDSPLFRWLRWLGVTLMSLDEMPLRLPEVRLQRVLLPSGGLEKELQLRYGRALRQQAYKVLPSSALLGDPYGTLRRLRTGWLHYMQEVSRASWQQLPVVGTRGAVHLLSLALSTLLRATGTSTLALNNGLAALLAEEGRAAGAGAADLSLVDGLLLGVGGLARETARSVERLVARSEWVRRLPPPLDGPVLMLLVPVGLLSGVRRMLLLAAVGGLSATRSAVEASRRLLRGRAQAALLRPGMGRARAPRELAPFQLVAPISHPDGPRVLASLPDEATAVASAPLLCAAQVHSPRCMLLVTAAGVVAAESAQQQLDGVAGAAAAVLWAAAHEELLLVQRQGALLRLLCLARPAGSTAAGGTLLHAVELASPAHAARLQELLSVATLNARGLACAPAAPRPTFWTILLAPPPGGGPLSLGGGGGGGGGAAFGGGGADAATACAESSPVALPGLSDAGRPTGPRLFAAFSDRSILSRSSPATMASVARRAR